MIVLIKDDIVEIDEISRSSGTVEVTTKTAHGYSSNDFIFIAGVTHETDSFNGKFQITVTDSDTFEYSQPGLADEDGFHGNAYKYVDFPDKILGEISITSELDGISMAEFSIYNPDNDLFSTYRNYHNKWIEIWQDGYDQSTDDPLFRGYIVDINATRNKISFTASGHEGSLNISPSGYSCCRLEGKLDGAPIDGNGGAATFNIKSGWSGAWTSDDQYTSDKYAVVTDAGTLQSMTEYTAVPGDEGLYFVNLEFHPTFFSPLRVGRSGGGSDRCVLLRFSVNLPRNIDQVTRSITKSTVQSAKLKLRHIAPTVGNFTAKVRLIPMDNCPPFKNLGTSELDLTNTTHEVSVSFGGETTNLEKSIDIADLVNDYIARFDEVTPDNKDPFKSWYKMGIVITPGDAAPHEEAIFYSKFDAAIWAWGTSAPHVEYDYTYPRFQKSYGPISDDDHSGPWIKTQASDTPSTDGVGDQDIIRIGTRHDKAIEDLALMGNENIIVDSSNIKDSSEYSIQDFTSSTPWKAIKNLALRIGTAGSYVWLSTDRNIHVDDDFDEYSADKIEESDVIGNEWLIDRKSSHLISKVIVRGNRARGIVQEYGRIEETDQPLPVMEFVDENIISGKEALDLATALFERYKYIPPSLKCTVKGYEDLHVGQKIQVDFKGVERVDIQSKLEGPGLSRSGNVTTCTTREPHLFKTGDLVTIENADDSSFNTSGVALTVVDSTSFTYPNNGADDTSGGGTASAYRWLVVRKIQRKQSPGGILYTTLSLGLGKSTPDETFANTLASIVSEIKDRTTPDYSISEGRWTEGAGGAELHSFKTINCPSGTDPVAENSADTLNFSAVSCTITGNSSTDTVEIDASLVNDSSPTLGGDLDLNQHDLLLDDNVEEVFQIRQGSNVYLCITTTNGSEAIKMGCGGTEVADFNMSEVKLSKDLNLQGNSITADDNVTIDKPLDLGSNSITADTNVTVDKPLKRTNEGYIFVKRGDSNWDISSLTHDSNWHELDISSVVSADAKSVLLAVEINDSTTNRQVALRQNGYTYVEGELRVLVSNVSNNAHFVIGLDADKKIEYYVSSGVNQVRMKVLGWYE